MVGSQGGDVSAINPSRPDWIHELLGELSIRLKNLPELMLPDGFAEHYVRHLPDSELGDLEPGRPAAKAVSTSPTIRTLRASSAASAL
mgnify:CR=1 FL=1